LRILDRATVSTNTSAWIGDRLSVPTKILHFVLKAFVH